MKRFLLSALACATAILLSAQANNYPNGSTVANFTVTDTDGNSHTLYNYTAAGKHVIVAFFFYNCIPCRQNAPKIAELYQMYGCNAHDLIVLRVNRGDDSDAQVASFATEFGGAFAQPPGIGTGGSLAVRQAFGISAYPTYCLIKPDNKMHNNDIWPVPALQTFIDAFPAGSNIQQAQCALVGVEEVAALNSLRVYPVPTTGMLQLEIPQGQTGKMNAEVRDQLGRLVLATTLAPNATTIDLSALSDGQYLLALRSASGASTVRRITIAH